MSVELTVGEVNGKEGLAIPEQMPALVEGIKQCDTELFIVSDAYALDNPLHGAQPEVLAEARELFAAAGLICVAEVEYEDAEPWHHSRNLLFLSRLALAYVGVIRLDTRNAIRAITQDGMEITGAHFDDDYKYRPYFDDGLMTNRMRQAAAFVAQTDPSRPGVLIGDLNDSHGNRAAERLIRPISVAAAMVPQSRIQSIGKRTHAITDGAALAILEEAGSGYRNANTQRTPTFPARRPILELDHCIVSAAVEVVSFEVMSRNSGTDHRAIRAKLRHN